MTRSERTDETQLPQPPYPLSPIHEVIKTFIQIHKEGKFFVAIDLITNVADQGLSEEGSLGKSAERTGGPLSDSPGAGTQRSKGLLPGYRSMPRLPII